VAGDNAIYSLLIPLLSDSASSRSLVEHEGHVHHDPKRSVQLHLRVTPLRPPHRQVGVRVQLQRSVARPPGQRSRSEWSNLQPARRQCGPEADLAKFSEESEMGWRTASKTSAMGRERSLANRLSNHPYARK